MKRPAPCSGSRVGLAHELVHAVADRAAQPAVADGHRCEAPRAGPGRPPRTAATPDAPAHAASAPAPAPARRSRRDPRAGAPRPSAGAAGRSPRPRSPWPRAAGASSRRRPSTGPRRPRRPPPRPGASSTGRLRSRSGTSANQSDRGDRRRGERAARLGEQDREDAQRPAPDRRARGRARCPCGASRARAGRARPARPWCPRRSSTGTARRSGSRARSPRGVAGQTREASA